MTVNTSKRSIRMSQCSTILSTLLYSAIILARPMDSRQHRLAIVVVQLPPKLIVKNGLQSRVFIPVFTLNLMKASWIMATYNNASIVGSVTILLLILYYYYYFFCTVTLKFVWTTRLVNATHFYITLHYITSVDEVRIYTSLRLSLK